jgi:hypothetical protein
MMWWTEGLPNFHWTVSIQMFRRHNIFFMLFLIQSDTQYNGRSIWEYLCSRDKYISGFADDTVGDSVLWHLKG